MSIRDNVISVIVPVHNTKEYVGECLDSILKQTFNQIEVICVDSSTDETTSIIQEMASLDNRIVFVQDSNSSYGYKINLGIKMAQGEYIAIVDSDDYIETDMLNKLYKVAVEQNVDMIKSDHTRFCVEDGKNVLQDYIVNAYRDFFYGNVFSAEEKPEILSLSNPAIWSGLYKRDYLIQNQIFLNESEGASYQDTGFAILTHMLAQRIYYLKESFYRYRTDNVNSSIKSQDKYWTVVEECRWIEGQLNSRNISNTAIIDAVKIRKIDMYYWNYKRLDEYWRKRFCDEVHEYLVEEFIENYNTENWRSITKQRLQVLLTGREEGES